MTPQIPAGEPAEYRAIEADDLIASHDPWDFTPDERYPEGVQERQYHADLPEQRKVTRGAEHLSPDIVLATSPTAVDGPPLVTADGIALGGNGRSMMLKRAYASRMPSARAYKAALVQRAPEFGLEPAAVEAMTAPVLVRVVEGLTRDSPTAELAAAVRRYNEGLTNAMDARARAVAQSRQLSDEAIAAFGDLLLSGEGSLRDLMRQSPGEFLQQLETAGIVTESNRSEWVAAGDLTDAAKDAIEGMFLGRVLGTADRIRATAPSLLKKIERAVPHLVAIAGKNPDYSLIPDVQAAVDLLNDARIRELRLGELLAQLNLFGDPRITPRVKELAKLLDRAGQVETGRRFAVWARHADFDPRQSTMFGRPASQREAFEALLQEQQPMRKANPKAPAKRTPKVKVAGSGDLRVTVVRDRQGRHRPALVRRRRGRPPEYQAIGEPAPTSLEAAEKQARALASRLGFAVELGGIVEEPRRKNPGTPPAWVPVVRSRASSADKLAADLLEQLGELPAGGTIIARVTGIDGEVRLELGPRGVRRVNACGCTQPQLRAELNQALGSVAKGSRLYSRREAPMDKTAKQRKQPTSLKAKANAPSRTAKRARTTPQKAVRAESTRSVRSRTAKSVVGSEEYQRGLRAISEEAVRRGTPYFPFGPPIVDE